MQRGLKFARIGVDQDFNFQQEGLMYKPTLFSEILKLIPRNFVQEAALECHSDALKNKFKTWHHLISMLYVHFSGVNSLRTLEQSLGSYRSSLYHLGCISIKRSTLSDANQIRNAGVFETIFQKMLALIPKRQIKRKLGSLKIIDSTYINLKGRGSEWAQANSTLRCYGLKVHVGIEHESSHLWFAEPSEANVNDVTVGKSIQIVPGDFYIIDKWYCDYNWWAQIHNDSAYFVTRLKQNAAYTVVSDNDQNPDIKDQTIILTNRSPRGGKKNECAGIPLRLVHVPHPCKPGRHLAVITNAMHLSTEEVAECYKKRWKIELLFKFLKQNVKLKKFIGESRNAVLIQIYTALIAYVLLMLYQGLSRPKSTLFEVINFIKAHLMNLVERILSPPRQIYVSRQKCLTFIRV